MPAAAAISSPRSPALLPITQRIATLSSPASIRSIRFASVRPVPESVTAMGNGAVTAVVSSLCSIRVGQLRPRSLWRRDPEIAYQCAHVGAMVQVTDCRNDTVRQCGIIPRCDEIAELRFERREQYG